VEVEFLIQIIDKGNDIDNKNVSRKGRILVMELWRFRGKIMFY
jgi:hypothetical protein